MPPLDGVRLTGTGGSFCTGTPELSEAVSPRPVTAVVRWYDCGLATTVTALSTKAACYPLKDTCHSLQHSRANVRPQFNKAGLGQARTRSRQAIPDQPLSGRRQLVAIL